MNFGQIWWQLALLAVGSYLLGSVNFAIILSRFRKKDITRSGSGNPGTMNMLRTFGIGLGALTLLLDVLKGFLPALAGRLIFGGKVSSLGFDWGYFALYLAGVFAVTGHIFPIFQKFGGKGVATTIGVFLCGWWWVTLLCFLVGVLYIFFFEYGGIGSLIMITGAGAAQTLRFFLDGALAFPHTAEFWVMCALVWLLVLNSFIMHRNNLVRMAHGVENRTKIREMIFGKCKKSGEPPASTGGSGTERAQERTEDRPPDDPENSARQ